MKNVFQFTQKWILRIFIAVAGAVFIYLSLASILSIIPYNNSYKEPLEGVEIYILSNGIHTDLVLPAITEYKDWTKEVKFENTLSGDTAMNYLAFGWGDKGFYLETPSWADLKFSTAFKAVFYLDGSAVHTRYYKRMDEDDHCKKIKLTAENYQKLISYIENSFETESSKIPECIKEAHYGSHDSFYEAKGRYGLFNTCNTWTNKGLKICGARACVWTPFDKGIFYQYHH